MNTSHRAWPPLFTAGSRLLPAVWQANRSLFILAALSVPLYGAALAHGSFRPRRMGPFFPIFFALFVLYALACWFVIRRERTSDSNQRTFSLPVILLCAAVFNLILIPSWPSLSDDMFRYIWDGRVQAAGVSPYRYPSNAPELADLRDEVIWPSMNRPDAVTIYPPFAQIIFAATWRIFPDSVTGLKLVMIAATLLAGGLLALLLRALGQPPERTLIFLWNPLLVFEVAHAAHVDALYLPLIVGAFLLRARAPQNRPDWRYEAGIGVLLGLAALVKLYPAMLAVCLWSLRDSQGRRRWRFTLPVALVVTVAAGYAFYVQPGVNALGFLPTYGREFFNVSPLMRLLTDLAMANHIRWYVPGNLGMPLLVALVSLWFVIHPARSPRQAILRCLWPIGIYLLINHNFFSWYALWLLPLVTLDLFPPWLPGWRKVNAAFAWWLFSGLTALSYTFFIRWQEESWGVALQFWPLYVLLTFTALLSIQKWLLSVRLKHQITTHNEPTTLPSS